MAGHSLPENLLSPVSSKTHKTHPPYSRRIRQTRSPRYSGRSFARGWSRPSAKPSSSPSGRHFDISTAIRNVHTSLRAVNQSIGLTYFKNLLQELAGLVKPSSIFRRQITPETASPSRKKPPPWRFVIIKVWQNPTYHHHSKRAC